MRPDVTEMDTEVLERYYRLTGRWRLRAAIGTVAVILVPVWLWAAGAVRWQILIAAALTAVVTAFLTGCLHVLAGEAETGLRSKGTP